MKKKSKVELWAIDSDLNTIRTFERINEVDEWLSDCPYYFQILFRENDGPIRVLKYFDPLQSWQNR